MHMETITLELLLLCIFFFVCVCVRESSENKTCGNLLELANKPFSTTG